MVVVDVLLEIDFEWPAGVMGVFAELSGGDKMAKTVYHLVGVKIAIGRRCSDAGATTSSFTRVAGVIDADAMGGEDLAVLGRRC